MNLVFLTGRGPLLVSQMRTVKGLYSSLRPMPPFALPDFTISFSASTRLVVPEFLCRH